MNTQRTNRRPTSTSWPERPDLPVVQAQTLPFGLIGASDFLSEFPDSSLNDGRFEALGEQRVRVLHDRLSQLVVRQQGRAGVGHPRCIVSEEKVDSMCNAQAFCA
jgi:hypothetical protein